MGTLSGGVGRVWNSLWHSGSLKRLADGMVARADVARDARHYIEAALLYAEALRIIPHDAAIQVQCGHMFKEAGDLANAEHHYVQARRLAADDPDLALQLGHFYKVAKRFEEAESAYRTALSLKPGWNEAEDELARVQRLGWGTPSDTGPAPRPDSSRNHISDLSQLVTTLAPRPKSANSYRDQIHVHRLGRRKEPSQRGMLAALRGIETVRGYCIAAAPIVEIEVLLDDRRIHLDTLTGMALDGLEDSRYKHVFNLWLDFSSFSFGRHIVELRFRAPGGTVQVHREAVIVATPLSETDFPDSDAVVSPSGEGPLVDRINTSPSVIRQARRTLLPSAPRTVLVLRTDQLGDLIVSVPAIIRLREVLHGARLVGLLSAANQEFGRTLNLFDDIVVADFPEDRSEGRRVMSVDKQRALRDVLEPYRFDLAIDLSESSGSRPLLLLSGAPFLYGFRHVDFPWLSAGFDGGTRDPINHLECVPHSAKVLGLVEWLGVMLDGRANTRGRPDLSRAILTPLGIGEHDRFAVLHTGARLSFSRWPYFDALVSKILEKTDLKVILMSDEPRGLPPGLIGSDRLTILEDLQPFDVFDALMSFCSVFVGNDSGPKHLAALRGANVVSVHMARVNWDEWGQEHGGLIVSRRVPCAGCAIHHAPDECGKDFACITQIQAEEIFRAVETVLANKLTRPIQPDFTRQ